MRSRKESLPPLLLAALMLFAGCVSTGGSAGSSSPSADCDPARELAGAWSDFRFSQLGPVWITLRFGCDCTYTSVTRLLWMRITEEGIYESSSGFVTFRRANASETIWPMTLDRDRLTFRESRSEEHAYRRTESVECGGATR